MDDPLTHELGFDLSVHRFVELFEAGELNLAKTGLFSVAPFGFTAADPHSAEYAAEVLGHWRLLSGRATYDPRVDEAFDLDQVEFLARPYPFSSKDPEEVGRYLGAVGWAIGVLRPSP